MTAVDESLTTLDRVLPRISVRPPYFGLERIDEVGPGLVRAPIPLTLPTRPEGGPMEAAQIARHLAILGSCAAALGRDDDQRHHYLAVKAHYTRCANSPEKVESEEGLEAEAMAVWIDKRTAQATIRLATESGRALNQLEVVYAVMTPRLFGKLYSSEESNSAGADNGSADPIAVARIEDTATGIRTNLGPIHPSTCAGHFPDVPAAPVAVVMGSLCSTAAQAVARELGREVTYRIEEGHVEATQLARAGQELVLEAEYQERQGEHHVVTGSARADGEVVGTVHVTMSVD